jgi:uncharacterized YccA/Bax inhibitor family protein
MEKRKIKEIGFLLGLTLLIAMVIRIINNEDTIIDFKVTVLAIVGSALGVLASIFIKKFQNKLRKKPIYISYNINDKEFVNKLSEKLTENGFSVIKETSIISPGDQINNNITETIKDAKVFLFVVSSNIYKSKFLKEEVLIAKHKGIKIIPIVKDDSELPSYLINYKIADFRGDFENAINNLTSNL